MDSVSERVLSRRNAFFEPVKFVPLSLKRTAGLPLRAITRFRACKKSSLESQDTNSRWTERKFMT